MWGRTRATRVSLEILAKVRHNVFGLLVVVLDDVLLFSLVFDDYDFFLGVLLGERGSVTGAGSSATRSLFGDAVGFCRYAEPWESLGSPVGSQGGNQEIAQSTATSVLGLFVEQRRR